MDRRWVDSPFMIIWFAGSKVTENTVHLTDVSHALNQIPGNGVVLFHNYSS